MLSDYEIKRLARIKFEKGESWNNPDKSSIEKICRRDQYAEWVLGCIRNYVGSNREDMERRLLNI